MNKQKSITQVVDVINKVIDKKVYSVGDIVKAYGKDCKIVEVLEQGRFHLKNLNSPFDSFIALTDEINSEVQNNL